jgi:hypothetical protein
MVEDKLAYRSLWVGDLACSSRAYHKLVNKNFFIIILNLFNFQYNILITLNFYLFK